MTSVERVRNTLSRKPVDTLAVGLKPWLSAERRWKSEGHIGDDEDVREHFSVDIRCHIGDLNSIANLDHTEEVIEETEETILKRDGNGASLRWHKLHESTPEHVGFTVKDRGGWEEHIKPHLLDIDRRRIPFEKYRREKAFCEEKQRYFCWHGMAPFEQMHPVCGHEYLLMGMVLDPDWVKEMAMTYAEFTIRHLEVLFREEGLPEATWFSEDLGFKGKPFMSPQMYKEIMFPSHKKLFDYVHSKGCKVIVHSCGFVEPLIPGLIEAGMDCLQAIENKAAMNLCRLAKQFGDQISFFGGIAIDALLTNDKDVIDKELKEKIPPVIDCGASYILHSDHSEPADIDHETIGYFLDRGRQIAAQCMKPDLRERRSILAVPAAENRCNVLEKNPR